MSTVINGRRKDKETVATDAHIIFATCNSGHSISCAQVYLDMA